MDLLNDGWVGNVVMALGLYDCAGREKWQIDPVTFSTMIRVYGTSGNFDGALNVYGEMKALGVKPNVIVYITLLNAMARAGRPWQVKTIFKMESNKIVPNRITYAMVFTREGSLFWCSFDSFTRLDERSVQALKEREELPPFHGIHAGHGKHTYLVRELISVFESHLREPSAPFYEAPDKVVWFLTTNVAAKPWLESRSSSPELVDA